ncbi:MAG: radical SAM protein [Actinobacteria bacterium]|nr:radical SAM protein [Actinomycetota bacterium]
MKWLTLLKSLAKSYISYTKKKERCAYFPYKLWIETTSRCNLACSACLNKYLSPRDRGDMDFNLFKKIIDQSKDYVYEIYLFHRGEPLLHPEINKMIEYARSSNIKTVIHTNAVLLDRAMSEKIVKSGLSKIYFSLDTFIKSDYEKNRKGADFDVTLKNIREFLKIKSKTGSKKPAAFILLMDLNDKPLSVYDKKKQWAEFNVFRKEFKGLGLDGFVKRKAHNWGGNLNTEVSKKNKHMQANRHIITCTFPWYSLTIFFNGKVYLCPQDFIGRYEIGDINKNTIQEIFNDEPIRTARKKLGSKNISGMEGCLKCDRLQRKTFAGVPAEYIRQFLK